MAAKPRIAIVGATGLVGTSLIELINEGHLPVSEVHLLASMNSAGERLSVLDRHQRVELLDQFDFEQVDIAFFAVPEEVAAQVIPKAIDAGARVLDASSAYVADTSVPLLAQLAETSHASFHELPSLAAMPTPAALTMAKVLKPLHDAAQVVQVQATVCESASHFGQKGVENLAQQAVKLLSGQENTAKPKLAFNLLGQVGETQSNGHTRYELVSALQVLRLLGQTHLGINITAVQAPVFHGQMISLYVTTARHLPVEEAEQLLLEAGMTVSVTAEGSTLTHGVGKNHMAVTRLRSDMATQNGLNVTIISDPLRVGVAMNMLHIAKNWLEIAEM